MIITPSLPLKTHPKEHNKHEDLEEGAEDMRVTAQKQDEGYQGRQAPVEDGGTHVHQK